MHEFFRYGVTTLLTFLIVCCLVRQRRYWREIHSNRPSGTLKAGYVISALTIFGAVVYAAVVGIAESKTVLMGVVPMAMLFALKITFSPVILAVILGICTFQFNANGSFPLIELWKGVTTVVTWRFPEYVRVTYAFLTFLWMIVAFFSMGSSVESLEDGLDAAAENLNLVPH